LPKSKAVVITSLQMIDNSNFFSASEIRTFLSYFPKGLVFLDLETTGLSPLYDKIVEIAAIKINADGTVHSFESLINPECPIPENVISIHHITSLMVSHSPKFNDVIPAFLDFLKDLPIVAQNARFDLGFIIFGLHHFKLSSEASPPLSLNNEIYDSCKWARKCLPKIKSHALGALVKYFQLPDFQYHRALADTHACALVTAKMLALNSGALAPEQGPCPINSGYLFSLTDFNLLQLELIPENLKNLIPYLREQIPIEIIYDGGTHPKVPRPLRPISFLPLPQGNVLYGVCLQSMKNKSFMLKKIRDFRFYEGEELEHYKNINRTFASSKL
jgi:DNA polymerase-3 subunit epsilon